MNRRAIPLVFGFLCLGSVLTACDPGTLEYGYYWNPKTVVYRAIQAVQDPEAAVESGDLAMIFSGRAYCQYSSEAGLRHLGQVAGETESASKRFKIEEPELIGTGKNLPGFRSQFGTILSGERYRIRILRLSDEREAFTLFLSCFKVRDAGSVGKSCSITSLKNHLSGDPNIPECDDVF